MITTAPQLPNFFKARPGIGIKQLVEKAKNYGFVYVNKGQGDRAYWVVWHTGDNLMYVMTEIAPQSGYMVASIPIADISNLGGYDATSSEMIILDRILEGRMTKLHFPAIVRKDHLTIADAYKFIKWSARNPLTINSEKGKHKGEKR